MVDQKTSNTKRRWASSSQRCKFSILSIAANAQAAASKGSVTTEARSDAGKYSKVGTPQKKICVPLIVIEVCQMNDTRSTKAHVDAPDQIKEGTIKLLE
jgi:hypothetical protein